MKASWIERTSGEDPELADAGTGELRRGGERGVARSQNIAAMAREGFWNCKPGCGHVEELRGGEGDVRFCKCGRRMSRVDGIG